MENRRMCPQCRAFITTRDRVCPYCNERVEPRQVERDDTGSFLSGLIPHARFVTMLILILNCGMFAVTTLYSMLVMQNPDAVMNPDSQTLILFGAKFLPGLAAGQWWRLLTAGFLHGGLIHIAMNMWVLMDLGGQVEELFGASRLIAIYFAATMVGFLASTIFTPSSMSVGASAGIFGLIGAMIALGTMHRSAMGDALRKHYGIWALIWIVLGFTGIFRMDNAAHIGGLVGGFGVTYLAGLPGYARPAREWAWRLVAYCCGGVTGLSFLLMFQFFLAVR